MNITDKNREFTIEEIQNFSFVLCDLKEQMNNLQKCLGLYSSIQYSIDKKMIGETWGLALLNKIFDLSEFSMEKLDEYHDKIDRIVAYLDMLHPYRDLDEDITTRHIESMNIMKKIIEFDRNETLNLQKNQTNKAS